MMIATLHLDGNVYRAERLALLRRQMIRHIKSTDASAQKVEQALASLAEANADPDHAALRLTSDQIRSPLTILRAKPSAWASRHCRARNKVSGLARV